MNNEIAFTEEHVDKIRQGEKRSTLRTVKQKNLYPEGGTVRIKETDILLRIQNRYIITLGSDGVTDFDDTPFSPPIFCYDRPPMQVLAEWEGFDDPNAMIDWFQGGNPWGVEYSLPQPFFLYIVEIIGDSGQQDGDADE